MKLSLTIPAEDMPDFGKEMEECRQDVRRRLAVMQRLFAAAEPGSGVGIGAAVAREAKVLALSPQQTRRLYDTFRKTLDWRTLINRARFPEQGENGLCGELIEHWKTLCERNQRKCKPAHREFIRSWRRGEPVGVQWPAVDEDTGIPRGCTYPNMMRRYAPTIYELRLARIGRGAASKMLPKVLSTRVDILVGQIFMNDDQDYDVNIAMPGVNRKWSRPSGFNTLDFRSGADILQGYKRTVINADGTKQKLRQVDYQWHLVSLLATVGYRLDTGTIIFDEHGTTNSGSDFMDRVRLATEGKVDFETSGIHGEQMAGLFRGQPRGNPNWKAARESWFNLLRNEMAALPAPTGMDRDHSPEESYGMEKYVRDLMDVIAARPELADALRLPAMRWNEFTAIVDGIIRRINLRTDHEMEGWGDLMTNEWRLTPEMPWQPASALLALEGPQRFVADALIKNTPGLWRVRQMCPWEVWEAGNKALHRVDGPMIPILLGPEAAIPVMVQEDHQFVVKDAEIEPEDMWFDAELTNGRMLGQRQECLAYLNPFLPHALQVCTPDGRWLGTAPRVNRLSRLDKEALQHRYGKVRRIESRLMAGPAARGAAIARERTAMREGNTMLIADAEGKSVSHGDTKARSKKVQAKPCSIASTASDAARARELLAEED